MRLTDWSVTVKLTHLKIENFRSIETLELEFPSYYTAICGKNNSGKTNIVKAIRSIFGKDSPYFDEEGDDTFASNFPVWKSKEEGSKITIRLDFIVNQTADAELHKFVDTFLALSSPKEELSLSVTKTVTNKKDRKEEEEEAAEEEEEEEDEKLIVTVDGQDVDQYKSKQIVLKLRSTRVFLVYNSTEQDESYRYRRRLSSVLGELAIDEKAELEKVKTQVNESLQMIANKHQRTLTDLLGRLEEKYEVGLTTNNLNLDYLPINIALGEKAHRVPLAEWGSGTKNRTMILLTLFRAKRISETKGSESKITPIIVIEEPESFLHPSAQAEFGRVLQDLAEEFGVQILATTHSPYLLNQGNPSSNILLKRRTEQNYARETERGCTSGDNWMEPFALALGLESKAFEPWRNLFFSKTSKILLVEGDSDLEYFKMLRDTGHGENRLQYEGEIFPYGGFGTLQNTILLKFIKNKYERVFITFDLDAESQVAKFLADLGFEKGKDYLAIGLDEDGKRDIEGLLPASVASAVFGRNTDLVRQAIGVGKQKERARNQLKRLCLEEFQKVAVPGEEHYRHFYPLAQAINKVLV
jgi:putative ATP-dependent endonuclease of the OLD family